VCKLCIDFHRKPILELQSITYYSYMHNICDCSVSVLWYKVGSMCANWQELNALLTPVSSHSSSSASGDPLGQLSWPADPVTSTDSTTSSHSSAWIKTEDSHKSAASESVQVSSSSSGDTATGLSLPANLTLAMSAAQVVTTCKGLGRWIVRASDSLTSWCVSYFCHKWLLFLCMCLSCLLFLS